MEESVYFPDPSRVEQHTFAILHKLEKVTTPNLHGAKGSQQGTKHIALWICIILSFLHITLQIHSKTGDLRHLRTCIIAPLLYTDMTLMLSTFSLMHASLDTEQQTCKLAASRLASLSKR